MLKGRRFFQLVLFIIYAFTHAAICVATGTTDTTTEAPRLEELISSISKTIEIESAELEELKRRQIEIQRDLKAQKNELRAHDLELSAAENLALIKSVSLQDLEKTRAMVVQTLNYSGERIDEVKKTLDELSLKLTDLEGRLNANSERIKNLRKSRDKDLPGGLLSSLNELGKILESKLAIANDIKKALSENLLQWQGINTRASTLLTQLDQSIAQIKEKQLFERKDNIFSYLKGEYFISEVKVFVKVLEQGFSRDFWRKQVFPIFSASTPLLLALLAAYILVMFVLIHLRRSSIGFACTEYMERDYPWLCRGIIILSDSLPLLGTIIFSYIYASSRNFLKTYPISGFVLSCLLVWLFASWVAKFLRLLKEGAKGEATRFLIRQIHMIVPVVRWLTLVYLAVQYILTPKSTVLFAYRVSMEISALAWFAYVANRFGKNVVHDTASVFYKKRWLHKVIVFWGYSVTVVGLIVELLGYEYFSVFWYAGWARTAVAFMWISLCFAALREWERAIDTSTTFAPTDQTEGGASLKWLIAKILWVVWLFGGLISCVLAWKPEKGIVLNFLNLLNTPIRITGFTIRPINIVYAVIIFVVTHVVNRWIRRTIKDHVLSRSGLEEGLQESIVTITGYLVWFAAIIMTLNVIGVSGTSLTVAFGALGVGLGFGLQHIFSNFVSGLILLFERPVQVGDIIEIEGILGEVRKINVRSTVVQTWDNASVIIPNSVLVSERVTNWSFRDTRVRRNIDVGVAYGSDLNLVRDTLLEIAYNHPAVFHKPEPSVLFMDFGDNALLFRLRVWTTVRKSLEVETEIRYEIARLFAERQIEIAFPQRDIHIRSIGPLEKLLSSIFQKGDPGG